MSSANGILDLHESLTYSAPADILMGDINFVSFKSDAVSYTPGQSCSFNLRSNNEFVILDRSYIKFSYTETGSVTTGSSISSAGASCFIKSVSDTISGLQLPVCDNWNVVNAVNLSNDTASRKSITTRCEYTGTYAAPGTAITTQTFGVARTAVMPIPTNLSSSNNVIPLAFFNGGWNVSYEFASYLTAYISANSGNSYTITNAEIVCCVVKPPDAYLQEVQKTLSSGNSLKIPLQLAKVYTNLLSVGTTQSIRIQPGYLSSLNSIINVYRPTADVNAVSKDSFKSNITNFQEYYINVNSQRYPRNFPVKVATENKEWLYQEMAGFNTSTSMLNASTIAVNDKLVYSWKSNSDFNSGISLNEGTVSVEILFSTAPTVNDILSTVVEFDCMLLVSQSNVSLLTSF